MMKTKCVILFAFVNCSVISSAVGQEANSSLVVEGSSRSGKPVIDSTTIESWYGLGSGWNDVNISHDGRFVAYKIANIPRGSHTITVLSTISDWSKQFVGTEIGFFSGDSKQYMYRKNDSLFFLALKDGQMRCITGIEDVQLLDPDDGKWLAWKKNNRVCLTNLFTGKEKFFENVEGFGLDPLRQWFVCKLTNEEKELQLYNLSNAKVLVFKNVASNSFFDSGKSLLLQTQTAYGTELSIVNLPAGSVREIWRSEGKEILLGGVMPDENGKQLTFTVQRTDASERSVNSVWYYKMGMERAVQQLNGNSEEIRQDLTLQGTGGFFASGKYINLILTQASEKQREGKAVAKLNVWNYKDACLQSLQLSGDCPGIGQRQHFAFVPVDGGQVVQLPLENKVMIGTAGQFAIVRKVNDHGDRFWRENQRDSIWLVSLADGAEKLCRENGIGWYTISPDQKYLVSFNEKSGHYFSLDAVTGLEKNISADCPVYLGTEAEYDRSPGKSNAKTGICGWIQDGESVLVYDTYDIWKLSLSGKEKPVCITNGYGRRNGIKLRALASSSFTPNSSLLLAALNLKTMENGFFKHNIASKNDPELLTMDDCVFYLEGNLVPNNGNSPGNSMAPIKARDADVWIVKRQTAIDSPNYFITTDFRTFRRLTNLQPHKKNNWLTTELVSFRQSDGTVSQGILYKPENFDPAKKYPLIFTYYFQYSQLLNQFPNPYYTISAAINIPWFVSRGYLVFTPDIYFTSSMLRGASALSCIEGAAEELSRLSYVDGSRMGIAGHSRAGGYTNYIVTHSKRFAAALEGAGVSDNVSSALQVMYTNGVSRLRGAEQEVFHGRTIWELKDSLLLKNPIMQVDKITTPLLIMHNRLDGSVPWEQAVELFVAMRRLNKKVWMLEYDKEDHLIGNKSNALDFTYRVTQFFDHYLKEELPPRWMTVGVPAALKGIDDGLQLDSSGLLP